MHFYINGIEWSVVFANSNNNHFQRSNGTYSVGVTDRGEKKIYLSDKLQGPFLRKVFTHEVCHAVCMSYGLFMPISQEERICDFVASYGKEVFEIVDFVFREIRRIA